MDKLLDPKQRINGSEFILYGGLCSLAWLAVLVMVYTIVFWLADNTTVSVLADLIAAIYSEVERGLAYFLNFAIGCSLIYVFLLTRYYPEGTPINEVFARRARLFKRYLKVMLLLAVALTIRVSVGLYLHFYASNADIMVLYGL